MTLQTANKAPANHFSGIESMYRQMMFHLAEHNRLGAEGKEEQPEYDEQYARFSAMQEAILLAPVKTAKDAVFKIAAKAESLFAPGYTNYEATITELLSSIETVCQDAGIDDSADIRQAA